MIKFFRNIRKNLIEQQKVRNYILYAIGEIFLVVIGILIALGINNWNETRKKKESARLHLETIAENIREDLVQLNYLYKFTDTTLQYSKKLTRQFQTLDTLNSNTSLYISSLLLEKSINPNKSGLETLNNSGELTYIPNQTQELLLKYYNLIDHILAREEISNTFIKIRYEPHFFQNYSFIINKDHQWKVSQEYYKDDPRTPKPIDPVSFLADEALETMVFGRHFQIKQQHLLYEQAIEVANKLLKSIKNGKTL